jgi:hypothetical protein
MDFGGLREQLLPFTLIWTEGLSILLGLLREESSDFGALNAAVTLSESGVAEHSARAGTCETGTAFSSAP